VTRPDTDRLAEIVAATGAHTNVFAGWVEYFDGPCLSTVHTLITAAGLSVTLQRSAMKPDPTLRIGKPSDIPLSARRILHPGTAILLLLRSGLQPDPGHPGGAIADDDLVGLLTGTDIPGGGLTPTPAETVAVELVRDHAGDLTPDGVGLLWEIDDTITALGGRDALLQAAEQAVR
jgi:hypothetical protein